MQKYVAVTLFILFFSSLGYAQSYGELMFKGDSLYQAKNYSASIEAYKSAFKLEKKNNLHLYNAACSAALAGDKELAFELLNAAFDNGWTNISHIKSDPDLTSLHDDSRWSDMLARMQRKVDEIEANYDKPLQAELLKIFEEDQKYRNMIDSIQKTYGIKSPEMEALWKVMAEMDSINLIKVSAILDKYGWVGKDKVGQRANQTIFLVIQHSDLATQQKYLPMMREAVKLGNASASSLALLEDRVALGEGRKQIYGSQIGQNAETGEYYVLPLEDPDNVDKRRAEVGLGPLADYIKIWGMTWNVEEYKRKNQELLNKKK